MVFSCLYVAWGCFQSFLFVSAVCDIAAVFGLYPKGDCDAQRSSSHFTDNTLHLLSAAPSASGGNNTDGEMQPDCHYFSVQPLSRWLLL